MMSDLRYKAAGLKREVIRFRLRRAPSSTPPVIFGALNFPFVRVVVINFMNFPNILRYRKIGSLDYLGPVGGGSGDLSGSPRPSDLSRRSYLSLLKLCCGFLCMSRRFSGPLSR